MNDNGGISSDEMGMVVVLVRMDLGFGREVAFVVDGTAVRRWVGFFSSPFANTSAAHSIAALFLSFSTCPPPSTSPEKKYQLDLVTVPFRLVHLTADGIDGTGGGFVSLGRDFLSHLAAAGADAGPLCNRSAMGLVLGLARRVSDVRCRGGGLGCLDDDGVVTRVPRAE